jgi:hypothetical protein
MLDAQNQGPQCTACGSPMKLTTIEPSMWGQDRRTFSCPRCKRVQRHIIDSGHGGVGDAKTLGRLDLRSWTSRSNRLFALPVMLPVIERGQSVDGTLA